MHNGVRGRVSIQLSPNFEFAICGARRVVLSVRLKAHRLDIEEDTKVETLKACLHSICVVWSVLASHL